MSGPTFEAFYRGRLWRLSVSTFRGKPRLSIWAHYQDQETGQWKACGGRRDAPGCIVPVDRVDELAEAVNAIAEKIRPITG